MNRSYMVIRPERKDHDNYTIRMLSGNEIQGLLSFQDKQIDGEVRYYYDITSKQPLSRMLEHRTIAGTELKALFTELLYTLKRMERFLLDEGQLYLHPDFIYIDPDSFKGCFCLIPGQYREFAAEFCELSQYLLDHVNQNDGEAVILAFSVFRECRKLNFGIDDIERCLRKQEKEREYPAEKSWTERKKESEEHLEEKTAKEKIIKEKVNKEKAEKEENEKHEKHKEYEGHAEDPVSLKWLLCGALGMMAAFPVGLYFVMGFHGIYHWKWWILAAELLVGTLLMVLMMKFREKAGKFGEAEIAEEEAWEVIFQEDIEENERENDRENDRIHEKNEIQTVLLNTAKPIVQECRKLIPKNGGMEIPLNYFPFIIGKNKDFVDFFLNQPGVSRLHVKFEETADGYSVTDLNSTNGTMVNGTSLAANETAVIKLGDELVIASEVYTFC